ncbi:MAG: hypothetical protein ABI380_14705 [Edaphobacter sp.]
MKRKIALLLPVICLAALSIGDSLTLVSAGDGSTGSEYLYPIPI